MEEKIMKKEPKQNLEFLVVDPQVDFYDPNGGLPVAGAVEDAQRLSDLIKRLVNDINDIHASLDSHRELDLGHPLFWLNNKGEHPAPFTLITTEDLENDVWRPFNSTLKMPAPWGNLRNRMIDYSKTLTAGGRYVMIVWPPHCRIGTPGQAVFPIIYEAFQEWEHKRYAMVDYVVKGVNPYTENYSIMQAEVPDPSDETTMLRIDLIKTLERADVVAISGQALSHCMYNTLKDLSTNFGMDSIKKLVLIEDTTSSVTGFENLGEQGVKELVALGMQTCKSKDFYI